MTSCIERRASKGQRPKRTVVSIVQYASRGNGKRTGRNRGHRMITPSPPPQLSQRVTGSAAVQAWLWQIPSPSRTGNSARSGDGGDSSQGKTPHPLLLVCLPLSHFLPQQLQLLPSRCLVRVLRCNTLAISFSSSFSTLACPVAFSFGLRTRPWFQDLNPSPFNDNPFHRPEHRQSYSIVE